MTWEYLKYDGNMNWMLGIAISMLIVSASFTPSDNERGNITKIQRLKSGTWQTYSYTCWNVNNNVLKLNPQCENICSVAKNFCLKLWSVKIMKILFTIMYYSISKCTSSTLQILIDYHYWLLFCVHLLHILNFFSNNSRWVLNAFILRNCLSLLWQRHKEITCSAKGI